MNPSVDANDDDLRTLVRCTLPGAFGTRFRVSESSTSTNLDARRAIEAEGPSALHGTVFTTLHQTEGRGTRGRSWWSPPDSAVAISIVVAPLAPLPSTAPVTLIAALALFDAASGVGARVAIRWPNDVVDLEGRKIAGVLAEALATSPPALIVGIGVNVRKSTSKPPPFLLQPFSDLEATIPPPTQAPSALGRAAFVVRFVQCFELRMATFIRHGLADTLRDFNAHSYLRGRHVVLRHGSSRLEGIFLGMDLRFRVEILPSEGESVALPAEQLELLEHRD